MLKGRAGGRPVGAPSAAAASAELYVRDEGTGPAVVLLHGLGGDHTVWNAVIPELARSHRVLAPDLRGHGRTPLPAGSTLSFPEILGDLTRLMQGRGIPRAHVVGISAGAFVGLTWALRTPGEVTSLVLCGGATHCDAHTRAVGRHWGEVYTKEGFDAFFLRLVKDLYAAEWIEVNMDGLDTVREQMRGRDFRAAFLWGQQVEAYDLRGRLGKFATPVLVLQGMDDKVVDSSHARLIRQSITGAQVRLFPLTGHMVPVERPAETVEALRGWLEHQERRDHGPGAEATSVEPDR